MPIQCSRCEQSVLKWKGAVGGNVMKSRSGSAEAAEAFPVVDLTPEAIGDYGVCGYKDVSRQVELRRKIAWFAV
jgi:hypothetical protein